MHDSKFAAKIKSTNLCNSSFDVSLEHFISDIILSFMKKVGNCLEKLTQNIYKTKIALVSISHLLMYILFSYKELDLKTVLRVENWFESF